MKLAPIYEAVAKRVAHNKNLIIAKVDATENFIDGVSIQGYPTIMFWPANNKHQPREYDRYRDEEEFVAFLKDHAA
jgi:thiol-disulfide isomerase/thioredoxin